MLLTNEDEEATIAYHKQIYLKDCWYVTADLCNLVKTITLKRAWNKINGILTKSVPSGTNLEGRRMRIQSRGKWQRNWKWSWKRSIDWRYAKIL